MLAALDNNHNVGRAQAVVQTGERKGEKRYNIVFPKGRKRWVAKPVMAKKDYSFVQDMVDGVYRVCAGTAQSHEVAKIKVPQLSQNIASQPRPDKYEVISAQKSRMVVTT